MLTQEQYDNRLARAERHAKQDLLLAGTYGKMNGSFKGCSVGCDAFEIIGQEKAVQLLKEESFGTGLHRVVADHDGTPEWLELLRDAIFEGLPKDKRAWWHVELARSLPVGIDLDPAKHMICITILKMSLENCDRWDNAYRDVCVAAIERIIACHSAPEKADWSAARSAARSAASAASAARSAAWSAASAASAESAARAASAAWSAAYLRIALAVIEIFKNLKN